MNDYLIHYGVKGMKWGVRNDKYKSADRATRKKYREAYKQSDEYKDKKASIKTKLTSGVVSFLAGATPGASAGELVAVKSAQKNNPKLTLDEAKKTGLAKYGRSVTEGVRIGSYARMAVTSVPMLMLASSGLAAISNLNIAGLDLSSAINDIDDKISSAVGNILPGDTQSTPSQSPSPIPLAKKRRQIYVA